MVIKNDSQSIKGISLNLPNKQYIEYVTEKNLMNPSESKTTKTKQENKTKLCFNA